MSSPVDRDYDERAMYVPPHARQPNEELPTTAAGAADRLRQSRTATRYEERVARRRHEDEVAAKVRSDDLEAEMGRIVRDNWHPSSLDPVPVPPPPKRRFGRSADKEREAASANNAANKTMPKVTLSMATRVFGAVGFAAIVALFVSGTNPFATSAPTFSESDRNANAAMIGDLPATSLRTARMTPAVATEQVAAPEKGLALAAYTPPNASTLTPSDMVASAPQSLSPAGETRAAAPEPAPVAALKLDPAEVAALLKRGQELVQQGDISGSRLLLQRAADAGDAQAALTLAATFDPRVLAQMKVIGVAGDEARARAWYKKAAALGSVEATRRLAQLN